MDKRSKRVIKATVQSRIGELLHEARLSFRAHPERSQRYISLIWKLVQKYKIRLTKEEKLSFCKRCLSLWVPGKTVQIAFDQRRHSIAYRCKKCGFSRKMVYK
ncbi:MAG: hypothetical protein QXH30_02055 [Candidatus Bilamarchaeaceae archaeon]